MKYYIARNKEYGLLSLYNHYPLKKDIFYPDTSIDGNHSMSLDKSLHPEITFENSPVEVEITIKKKND